MSAPRFATIAETCEIADALKRAEVIDWSQAADLIARDIVIIPSYISDGPGFAGRLAIIVGGEPNIILALGFDPREGIWRVFDIEPTAAPFFCQSCSESFEP